MSPALSIQLATTTGALVPAGHAALGLLLYLAFIVAPTCLLAWLASYLLSLPLRRQERARFFLHLLESVLKQGRPLESTLVEMAKSNDPTLGKRFRRLAAYLGQGLRFGRALENVPRLLPPQVTAMLRAGEELGDLTKVLPACRYLLKDAQSHVRGAASYLVVLAFVLSPFAVLILTMLVITVFPKFAEIANEMTGSSPPIFRFVQQHAGWLIAGEIGLFAIITFSALLYIGGPRFLHWFQFRSAPLVDWIAWHVPWKRKRMQRNFSAMLAALLDGGVPENEAARLAGDCAANEIFRRRVARLRHALAQGARLSEAVQWVDASGEFRWRLTNAAHRRADFMRALAGWHEALDAKAFQQEQAAAHTVTSALVLANGLFVALVALSVFGMLIFIIEEGVLW